MAAIADVEAAFHAAANNVTPRNLDHLASIDVMFDTAPWTGLVGGARVEVVDAGRRIVGILPISTCRLADPPADGDGFQGTFQWSPDGGIKHLIVPVGRSYGGCWWDSIDDLVAFRTADPGKWRLMTGADPVLGADHVADAIDRGDAVTLVATPLDWLRRRGDAACVLDWRRFDPRFEFGGARVVECASAPLAKRLRARIAALTRPGFDVAVAKHAATGAAA